MLEELIKIKNKIIGIAIEFHYPENNMKQIKKFIKKIDLKITHIHGNNFWKLNRNGNPDLLEITFEKKPLIKGKKIKNSHILDMPNNPGAKEVLLKFDR